MPILETPNGRVGFSDEGSGEPVVLLHSSATSRRQWWRLQQEIGDRYRLLAVDLYGYGETDFPADPGDFRVEREVGLVELLMARVTGAFHLVGHSYGGVVALKTALKYPGRVRSVYVHEPVLFGLLREEGWRTELAEISALSEAVARHVAEGNDDEAARVFIDYWSGEGTWAAIPERRRPDFARAARKVALDFAAIFAETDSPAVFGALTMPVRVTAGTTSPQPARRVAELLGEALGPGVLQFIEGAGHMAPLTHPDRINALILSHLAAHPIG